MSLPATEATVVGVDGCRFGWIAVSRSPDDVFAAKSFARLADLLAWLDPGATVAVDMPIGLPDRIGPNGRGPEAALRPVLGPFASSAFSIPSRAAVHVACGPFKSANERSAGFQAACAVARGTSEPPRAFSIQAFGLFPKIRELDVCLRRDLSLAGRVIESHPEGAFRRLNGEHPLRWRKKGGGAAKPGLGERRELLVKNGLPLGLLAQKFAGVGADDLLDAAVLLFSAARFVRGEAAPYPDPPSLDAEGLPIGIWI